MLMRNPLLNSCLFLGLGGLAIALVLRGSVPALAQSAATQPASAPAAVAFVPSGEWPAFHGGGPLRGVAAAIAPKPLALRWTYKTDEQETASIEGSAAIAGGVVYVGDSKGVLHAVDLATGKAKWTYKATDAIEAAPLVCDGKVLLGDLGGIFHCVSAADGKKLWTFDTDSTIHSSANVAGEGKNARVIFGDDGSNVICLNVADGSKAWEQATGDRVNGAPAIGFGDTFVSGCDAHLHAMKLTDGSEQFSADVGAICPGSPAILDDRIIIGTDGGRVVCFSSEGKQLWEFQGIGDNAMVYSSPAVADGTVVVGARDRKVHALDLATGKQKWEFATHGDVDSSPAISGSRVFVGSRDKNLYVLDLKTGEPVGEFTAGRAIAGSPAVGEGVVVIGDTAGNLYCLEPK
jgi:outer membrane protein assembly factor BamB